MKKSQLNYQCFEVHEKIKYGFITSIRKTKLFVIVKIDGDISSRKCSCVKVYSLLAMRVFGARATTAQKYPGRDTFEFDQGQVTKNQPITVLVLMSGSLGM